MNWERDRAFSCEMRNWRNWLVGCRALRRMLQVLACPGAWASTKQRQQSVFTLHHECIQTASEDRLFCGKWESSSLGSSCAGRNDTKCNKNLVAYALSHGGLARDCWGASLTSRNKQLSVNNYFHSLPRLFWWSRAEKSSIALSFTYTFWIQFHPAFTSIPPYTFHYNSWVF